MGVLNFLNDSYLSAKEKMSTLFSMSTEHQNEGEENDNNDDDDQQQQEMEEKWSDLHRPNSQPRKSFDEYKPKPTSNCTPRTNNPTTDQSSKEAWRKEVWKDTETALQNLKYKPFSKDSRMISLLSSRTSSLFPLELENTVCVNNADAQSTLKITCYRGDCLDAALQCFVSKSSSSSSSASSSSSTQPPPVLMVSSSHKPSGFREGYHDQEAEVYRRTTLSLHVDPSDIDEYYHQSDKGYFVDEVEVFRAGATSDYAFLPNKFSISCACVTAPNNNSTSSTFSSSLKTETDILTNSLRLFFRMAIKAERKIVVPIALGCGENSRCNPAHVAKIMMRVIVEECFNSCIEEVYLAISDDNVFQHFANRVMLRFGTMSDAQSKLVSLISHGEEKKKLISKHHIEKRVSAAINGVASNNSHKRNRQQVDTSAIYSRSDSEREAFSFLVSSADAMTTTTSCVQGSPGSSNGSNSDLEASGASSSSSRSSPTTPTTTPTATKALQLFEEIFDEKIERSLLPGDISQQVSHLDSLCTELKDKSSDIKFFIRDIFANPESYSLSIVWILNMLSSFFLIVVALSVSIQQLDLDFMMAPYVNAAEGCFFQSITQSTQQNNMDSDHWQYADQPGKTCLRNGETMKAYAERWLNFVLGGAQKNSDCEKMLFALGGNQQDEKIRAKNLFKISDYLLDNKQQPQQQQRNTTTSISIVAKEFIYINTTQLRQDFTRKCVDTNDACHRFLLLTKTDKPITRTSSFFGVTTSYFPMVLAEWYLTDSSCRKNFASVPLFNAAGSDSVSLSDSSGLRAVVIILVLSLLILIGGVFLLDFFASSSSSSSHRSLFEGRRKTVLAIWFFVFLIPIISTMAFLAILAFWIGASQEGLTLLAIAASINLALSIPHLLRSLNHVCFPPSSVVALRTERYLKEQVLFGFSIGKHHFLNHWGFAKSLLSIFCCGFFLAIASALSNEQSSLDEKSSAPLSSFFTYTRERVFCTFILCLYSPIGLEILFYFPNFCCSSGKVPVLVVLGLFVAFVVGLDIGYEFEHLSSFFEEKLVNVFSTASDAAVFMSVIVGVVLCLIVAFKTVNSINKEIKRKPNTLFDAVIWRRRCLDKIKH